MPDSLIAKRLASLSTLSKPALCDLWWQLFKKEPPPEIRKDLMLRIAAHRLQEQAFGGLSDAGCRRLRQLATTFVSNRPPINRVHALSASGRSKCMLSRWNRKAMNTEALVTKKLSEIARLITGTRWSGPAFFGLKALP
jgi:hypothetical protein